MSDLAARVNVRAAWHRDRADAADKVCPVAAAGHREDAELLMSFLDYVHADANNKAIIKKLESRLAGRPSTEATAP